jgi:polyisoprenoid-binding protein YceI
MTTAQSVDTYRLDVDRTTIAFSISHLAGLAKVTGGFHAADGAVTVGPAGATIRVEIPSASFHTGNARRDKDIHGKRFMDVANHPTMTFTGTATGDLAGESGRIDGELSFRGRAPVTLTVARVPGEPMRFTATGVLNRYHAGLAMARGIIGRDLTVTIDAVLLPAR